jgi:hypothetical protein
MEMCRCDRLSSRRVFVALLSIVVPWTAWSQSAPKLNLNAELVLTSEFCTSEMKRGNGLTTVKEKFPVGEKLCPGLKSEVPSIFASLKQVDQIPAPNTSTADIILVPKIGDIGATQKSLAFSKRELVVILEWTALNSEGKTLWVSTVQASGKRNMGNMFTHGKNMRKINDDVVDDAIEKSIETIISAPELIKLVK